MGIKTNLDGVEAWQAGGGILGPGKHPVVVADVEEGTSSGHHPQLELRLESLDPGLAGAGIRDWVTITPGSLGRVRQLLEAAGIDIPAGEFEIPTIKLMDKRLTIFVAEEPNQKGEKRNRVKSYAPLDDADIPADTKGLPAGNGAAEDHEELPF